MHKEHDPTKIDSEIIKEKVSKELEKSLNISNVYCKEIMKMKIFRETLESKNFKTCACCN